MISRVTRVRSALLASLSLGALLAGSLATPAYAATTHDLAVTVASKSGAPLPGLAIYALPVAEGRVVPHVSQPTATAVKSHPGRYTFTGLLDYTYTLYFETSGATAKTAFSQLLGGESVISRAQTIPATTSSLSVTLATNATVKGKITGPTGKALKGAYIQSYLFDGTSWGEYSYAVSDAKGKYSLTELDPGSYKFQFFSPIGQYSPGFADGAADLDQTAATVIGVGSTTTLDKRFRVGSGGISGKSRFYFRSDGPYAMAKAVAAAFPVVGRGTPDFRIEWDRGTYSKPSDSKGKWKIGGLAAGDYMVELEPYYSNEPRQLLGNYGELVDSFGEAEIFAVVAGHTLATAATDADLKETGAAVTVTVTSSSSSTLLAGQQVTLQRETNTSEVYQGTTAANGRITFGHRKSGKKTYPVLQNGNFTLTVVSPNGAFEPNQRTIYVGGEVSEQVALQTTTTQPGYISLPSIANTSLPVGQTYAVAAQPARDNAQLSYRWLRNDQPIYGATGASYRSRAADIGSQLSVRVAATSFGHDDAIAYASVAGIVTGGTKPTPVVAPTVTSDGDPHTGTTIHAYPGTWSVPGLRYTYQWLRDGDQIPFTGRDYVVADEDLHHSFQVEIRATKSGYPDADPVLSEPSPTVAVGPAITVVAPPIVSTTSAHQPKGSLKYTVSTGTWTALRAQFTYSWKLAGTEVSTTNSYVGTSTATSLKLPLTVTISASAPGWTDGETTTSGRKGTPGLTSTAKGTVTSRTSPTTLAATTPVPALVPLEATGGTWSHAGVLVPDASTTFQWMRARGTAKPGAIAGATAAHYTPTVADVGAKLAVVVTARSTEWANGTVVIPAGTVASALDLQQNLPRIGLYGNGIAGRNVNINSFIAPRWDELHASVTWQWWICSGPVCAADSPLSSFTKIAGATQANYTPQTPQVGSWIALAATGSAPGYAPATHSSVAIKVLAENSLTFTAPLTMNSAVYGQASATVGETLSAWPASTDPYVGSSGTSITWEVCSSDCSTESSWSAGTGTVVQQSPPNYYTIYRPSSTDWANGQGRIRAKQTITRLNFLTATEVSDSWVINSASFASAAPATIAQGPGTTNWTVTAPDITSDKPGGLQGVTWYVGSDVVSTQDSYEITAGDAGKPVFAQVSYAATGYAGLTRTLVAQVGDMTGITAAAQTVTGVKIDEPFAVAPLVPWTLPQNSLVPWVLSYTWKVGQYTVVTDGPYAPSGYGAQVGASISVTTRAVSPIYGELTSLATASQVLVAGDPIALAHNPSIHFTGQLGAGTTVTVSDSPTAVPGWNAHAFIQTSTDKVTWTDRAYEGTFVPTQADVGSWVRATGSAYRSGHPAYAFTTQPVLIGKADEIRELAAPSLAGDFRVGATVTLDPGKWTAGSDVKVQWLLNGSPIAGATGTSYVPLPRNYGDELSARVTASGDGQLDHSDETNRERVDLAPSPAPTKPPIITGLTVLTVVPGSWSVSGLTFHFQWKANGAPIASATADTYTLASGQSKADITVVVTTERFGYATGTTEVPAP